MQRIRTPFCQVTFKTSRSWRRTVRTSLNLLTSNTSLTVLNPILNWKVHLNQLVFNKAFGKTSMSNRLISDSAVMLCLNASLDHSDGGEKRKIIYFRLLYPHYPYRTYGQKYIRRSRCNVVVSMMCYKVKLLRDICRFVLKIQIFNLKL